MASTSRARPNRAFGTFLFLHRPRTVELDGDHIQQRPAWGRSVDYQPAQANQLISTDPPNNARESGGDETDAGDQGQPPNRLMQPPRIGGVTVDVPSVYRVASRHPRHLDRHRCAIAAGRRISRQDGHVITGMNRWRERQIVSAEVDRPG